MALSAPCATVEVSRSVSARPPVSGLADRTGELPPVVSAMIAMSANAIAPPAPTARIRGWRRWPGGVTLRRRGRDGAVGDGGDGSGGRGDGRPSGAMSPASSSSSGAGRVARGSVSTLIALP